MVDNVLYQAEKLAHADTSGFETAAFKQQATANGGRYGVITLHRPSNVDSEEMMTKIVGALKETSNELPLIFPVHPRTRNNMEKFGIDLGPNVTLVGPQAYMPFLNLWKDAGVVLTDSGGLQEGTTALGVPCIAIRENTERPVTVDDGSNVLEGTDPVRIVAEVRKVLHGEGKQGRRPKYWDGKAAERIVTRLRQDDKVTGFIVSAAGGKGFLVQAGVFAEPANAEALRRRLSTPARKATIQGRVMLGPYERREDAEAALARVRSERKLAGTVVAAAR